MQVKLLRVPTLERRDHLQVYVRTPGTLSYQRLGVIHPRVRDGKKTWSVIGGSQSHRRRRRAIQELAIRECCRQDQEPVQVLLTKVRSNARGLAYAVTLSCDLGTILGYVYRYRGNSDCWFIVGYELGMYRSRQEAITALLEQELSREFLAEHPILV